MNIQDVISKFNAEHERGLGGHTVIGALVYNLTYNNNSSTVGNFGTVNAERLEKLSKLGRMFCIHNITFDIDINQAGDGSLKRLAFISGRTDGKNISLVTGKSFKKIRGCFFRFIAKTIKSSGPILVPCIYSGCGTVKTKEFCIEKNGKSRWSNVINESAPYSISAERWSFEHTKVI